MMFNVFSCTAPSYMVNYIPCVVQHHNTRNSTNSFILHCVNSFGSLSFRHNGVKLWNSLPNHIKYSNSKDKFKSKCKQYLYSKWLRVKIQNVITNSVSYCV